MRRRSEKEPERQDRLSEDIRRIAEKSFDAFVDEAAKVLKRRARRR